MPSFRPSFLPHLQLTAACAVLLAASGLMASQPALATTGYLGWANKAAAPDVPPAPVSAQPTMAMPQGAPQAATQTPAPSRYDVPASPYGQVGYPFRTLGWSNKSGESQAPQAPVQRIASQIPPAPVQMVPQQAPVYHSAPDYRSAPAAASAPPPPSQPRTITQNGHTYVLPSPRQGAIEPEDDPVYNDVVAADAPPPPPPVIRAPTPAPAPAPVAPIAAQAVAAPAPSALPAADDGGYQVPASSKYAARIAAARAAADAASSPASQPAAPEAPIAAPMTLATATAPTSGEPLAAQETDHVFIPGEQYRSAADEPRFYSLHRQYGFKPDPITVDHSATGALLEPGYDIQTADDKTRDDSASDTDSKDGNAPAGDDPK